MSAERKMMNEIDRVSDIPITALNDDNDFYWEGIWVSRFALKYWGIHLLHDDGDFTAVWYKVLTQDEYPDSDQLRGFDDSKPLCLCIVDTVKGWLKILVGTSSKTGYAVCAVAEEPDLSGEGRMAISGFALRALIYVNRIFLTQPPKPSKTRIMKEHTVTAQGQWISKPRRVTFYQLPKPSEIDTKKIAAYKREWHCPAWGVRGHYRHYKSGKVIFIEQYVKGKDRGKYKGREYDLRRV